jgi:hypothetical protein
MGIPGLDTVVAILAARRRKVGYGDQVLQARAFILEA